MVSEIVGSGACQNVRATTGGTTATQTTTIQYGTEVMPMAIAVRQTATAQTAKSSVFLFSENMKPV